MIDESINIYLLNKSPDTFNTIMTELEKGELPSMENIDKIIKNGDIILIDSLGRYLDYTVQNITNNFNIYNLSDTDIEIIKAILLHIVDDEEEILKLYESIDKKYVLINYFLNSIDYDRFTELLESYGDEESIEYLIQLD